MIVAASFFCSRSEDPWPIFRRAEILLLYRPTSVEERVRGAWLRAIQAEHANQHTGPGGDGRCKAPRRTSGSATSCSGSAARASRGEGVIGRQDDRGGGAREVPA